MAKTIAFVRSPGPSFNEAISSNLKNQPIDIKRACLQHESYISALKEIGLDVISLPSADEFPDAPFVEDTTVVFDHIALACPNKEKSRRGEGPSIHKEIKKHITMKALPPSANLDGGDVLNTEEKIFVGISSRTNLEAVNSLAKFTTKPVIPVKVIRGLHLKTSVSYIGNNIIVLDPSSIETTSLRTFKWIETNGHAANCLAIGNIVLISKGCTKEADKIRLKGFKTREVDISEFEKADGGLTCLSIILKKN